MRETTLALRRFELERTQDISGLSGTGVVAEGVQFSDGTVVVRWKEVEGPNYERGVRATTVFFPDIRAVEALHGHNGATTVEWLDDEAGLSDAAREFDEQWAEIAEGVATVASRRDRKTVELLGALADDMDERGRPGADDSELDQQSRRQIREDVKRLRHILDRPWSS